MSDQPENEYAAFAVHMLNDKGKERAAQIQMAFSTLMTTLEAVCGADGREMAITRTKLEEACFFAKKAMAVRAENQE